DIIRNWLDACNTKHSGHCSTPIKQAEGLAASVPLWLIDVENECLVSAPRDAKYMALSYVWGYSISQISSTTTADLKKLQEKGSLTREGIDVPKTIGQVMKLASRIHIPFLWVDKFCIVQDDPSKQAQFDSMAAIYAGAYLTVVDAEGECADDGIDALDDESSASSISDELQFLSPGQARNEIIQKSSMIRAKEDSWSTRGWTLQEQLFSRRKVIFQNSTVNWECHCACWQEGQGLFGGDHQGPCSSVPHGSLINPSVVPDMYRYARLISRYNDRDLTFTADAINAFAGVLSDLSVVFRGGFVSGLPVFCFDAVLIWQPWGPMEKRFNDSSADPNDLPSWSWVGWQCELHSESLRSAYGYMRGNVDEFSLGEWYPTSWQTYPTVHWYYSDTINGEKYYIRRLMSPTTIIDAQNETYTPPEGWQKLRCPRSNRIYYRNGPCGDGFWYPVPLVEPNQLPLPVNRSRFLHCSTRRAFLKSAYPETAFCHLSSTCKVIELLDPRSGGPIGILRLPEEQGETSYPNKVCELVELSAGSVEDQPTEEVSFDEWKRKHKEWSSPESEKYEFYNVMWVERDKDGVCFRRAIGRVIKNAWEELDKDEVDITIA
ncbi:heterokaryon incompatibility protein-domain-containing protein, partial [Cadophora sp. MPI-SDFR-AT-0126]